MRVQPGQPHRMDRGLRRERSARACRIRSAVSSAVPEGASFLRSWCISMISASLEAPRSSTAALQEPHPEAGSSARRAPSELARAIAVQPSVLVERHPASFWISGWTPHSSIVRPCSKPRLRASRRARPGASVSCSAFVRSSPRVGDRSGPAANVVSLRRHLGGGNDSDRGGHQPDDAVSRPRAAGRGGGRHVSRGHPGDAKLDARRSPRLRAGHYACVRASGQRRHATHRRGVDVLISWRGSFRSQHVQPSWVLVWVVYFATTRSITRASPLPSSIGYRTAASCRGTRVHRSRGCA